MMQVRHNQVARNELQSASSNTAMVDQVIAFSFQKSTNRVGFYLPAQVTHNKFDVQNPQVYYNTARTNIIGTLIHDKYPTLQVLVYSEVYSMNAYEKMVGCEERKKWKVR